MFRLVSVALVFAATVGLVPANAADQHRKAPKALYKAPPPPPPPLAHNWGGFYAGINGGGAWGKSRHDEIAAPTATTGDFNFPGGLFGGTGGFNWQISPWVLGIEGDVDWVGLGGTVTCPNSTFQCSTRSRYLDTLRGRVGFAWDRFLVYGTGGAAFGDIRQSFNPSFNGVNGSSADQSGWAAGGGVEFALWWPQWTGKVEYLHVGLSDFTCAFVCTGVAGQVVRIKLDENIVRAGINYHFNLPGM
jgi:outer membrane immunogenic protein